MASDNLQKWFGLDEQVAVITGGSGVLGQAMAVGLAEAGAKVAVLGRDPDRTRATVTAIEAIGGTALAFSPDVFDLEQLVAARESILETWGRLDILVNAVGGNLAAATVPPDGSFFDMPLAALREVLDLNLLATLGPSQVFGRAMLDNTAKNGCIVNISSMASSRALSRVVGYGAAKAAVDNFTRWLATELAFKYGAGLRVNAIAPGFFLSVQNRTLLTNQDGSLTERGQRIVAHTPAGRLGVAEELISTLVWLCGPGASFVNGVVVPVDGGFSSFSGV